MRSQRSIVGLAAGALVVVAALVAAGLLGDRRSVLEVPAPGQVRPDVLRDGTPVFVARDGDGDQVRVLDARAPASSPGWVGVIGWCPAHRGFYDRLTVRRWAADGRPRLPAGPGRAAQVGGEQAPSMASFAVERAGEAIRVGARRPPDPEAATVETRLFRLCAPDQTRTPPLPGRPAGVASIAADPHDGWHRVDAAVRVAGGEPIVCERAGTRPQRPCLKVEAEALAQRPRQGRWLGGTLAVRVDGGRVITVAVPADVAEIGGPMR